MLKIKFHHKTSLEKIQEYHFMRKNLKKHKIDLILQLQLLLKRLLLQLQSVMS